MQNVGRVKSSVDDLIGTRYCKHESSLCATICWGSAFVPRFVQNATDVQENIWGNITHDHILDLRRCLPLLYPLFLHPIFLMYIITILTTIIFIFLYCQTTPLRLHVLFYYNILRTNNYYSILSIGSKLLHNAAFSIPLYTSGFRVGLTTRTTLHKSCHFQKIPFQNNTIF
jgi:hypothetical protein